MVNRISGGSDGKESAYSAGTPVQSLGQEYPLQKEMAVHSSILTWRISWTEEPGGPWDHRVGMTEQLTLSHRLQTRTAISQMDFKAWANDNITFLRLPCLTWKMHVTSPILWLRNGLFPATSVNKDVSDSGSPNVNSWLLRAPRKENSVWALAAFRQQPLPMVRIEEFRMWKTG